MKQEKIIEKQVERSCLHCKYFRAGRRKSLEDVLKNMKKNKENGTIGNKVKKHGYVAKEAKRGHCKEE